ncbi:hypothetical protein BC826DRAFT_1106672 [Russula brevipes]|nr:hypothetical protein BC826DRAFT_1106672 [Russula brevipes]
MTKISIKYHHEALCYRIRFRTQLDSSQWEHNPPPPQRSAQHLRRRLRRLGSDVCLARWKDDLGFDQTCPPTKRDTTAAKRSAINIDKRQNICTDGACKVLCDTTPAPPSAGDCTPLIDYIASYAPAKLTLAAGQTQAWALGTCGILVANGDTVSYTICYETIAYDATITADTCFGETAEAICIGTGKSGDNYVVAITSNVSLSA